MKKLKTYKQLFEAGEWAKDVDLEFVLENPDCNDEECLYIKSMYKSLKRIEDFIDDEKIFKIHNIVGYDLYSGPCAEVYIFNKLYNVWNGEQETYWIESFPVDNTSEQGLNPGYEGYEEDIIEILDKINELGGDPNSFNDIEKYNL